MSYSSKRSKLKNSKNDDADSQVIRGYELINKKKPTQSTLDDLTKKELKKYYRAGFSKRHIWLRRFTAAFILITILILVGVVGFFSYQVYNEPNIQTEDTPSYSNSPSEAASINKSEILEQINKHRTNSGVKPLLPITQLDDAAEARARSMIVNNYNDNASNNPLGFINNTGYIPSTWSLTSYKIESGYKNLKQVIQNSLINTDDLRKAYVDTNVTQAGIGVVVEKLNGVEYIAVVVYLASPYQNANYTTAAGYLPSSYGGGSGGVGSESPSQPQPASSGCNYQAQQTYTNSYNAAVNAENQSYNSSLSQINQLLLQLQNQGAGNSSAYQQALAQKGQLIAQHNSTLLSLSTQYHNDLANIGCS